MYEAALQSLIRSAFARLQSELRAATPVLAKRTLAWMSQLARSSHPAAYFTRLVFPVLPLPWWIEKTLRRTPDKAFHADLLYSTINGYYYIRLIDNLMDGHAPGDATLLPAAAFFHAQFQLGYQRHFEHGHPFWRIFAREWFRSAEMIARETGLAIVGPKEFRRISAEKVCAMRIPIAAVCLHNHRSDLIRPWRELCDALGGFAQMMDDVFDWHADLSEQHRATYFLCEATRRRRRTESMAAWIVRDGFCWGVAAVRARLAEARERSRVLHCPDLERYLARQEALLVAEERALRPGLRGLAALAPLLPA